MYSLRPEELDNIRDLYQQGYSAQEIKDLLSLPQTPRSIQRNLANMGVIRKQADAFRIAVKKGRVLYHTNPNKIRRLRLPTPIRMQILKRDKYRCKICGATAMDSRLQVDHINEDKNDNRWENLQVLCEECNKGKHLLSKNATH